MVSEPEEPEIIRFPLYFRFSGRRKSRLRARLRPRRGSFWPSETLKIHFLLPFVDGSSVDSGRLVVGRCQDGGRRLDGRRCRLDSHLLIWIQQGWL